MNGVMQQHLKSLNGCESALEEAEREAEKVLYIANAIILDEAIYIFNIMPMQYPVYVPSMHQITTSGTIQLN